MNYDDARPMIRDGDLIAVKRRSGLLAVLTRLVTKSPYTHAGIALWSDGRLLLAQANGGGVNMIPLSQEAEFAFDVYGYPAGLDPIAIVAQAWNLVGVRRAYGFMDLFRIWAYLWFGLPLPARDDGDYICSALAAQVYLLSGWAPQDLPSLPWPGAVVAALKTRPRLEVLP